MGSINIGDGNTIHEMNNNVVLPDKSLVSRAIEADLRANLTQAVELLRRVMNETDVGHAPDWPITKDIHAFLSEMEDTDGSA